MHPVSPWVPEIPKRTQIFILNMKIYRVWFCFFFKFPLKKQQMSFLPTNFYPFEKYFARKMKMLNEKLLNCKSFLSHFQKKVKLLNALLLSGVSVVRSLSIISSQWTAYYFEMFMVKELCSWNYVLWNGKRRKILHIS